MTCEPRAALAAEITAASFIGKNAVPQVIRLVGIGRQVRIEQPDLLPRRKFDLDAQVAWRLPDDRVAADDLNVAAGLLVVVESPSAAAIDRPALLPSSCTPMTSAPLACMISASLFRPAAVSSPTQTLNVITLRLLTSACAGA